MPLPYVRKVGKYYYICKKVDGKHQIVKKLPKGIDREQAQKLLNEWLPRYKKQRDLIDAKINKLREFKKRHGIPYSVWNFKERGKGGDKNFLGNTPPKVIRQVLLMLAKPLYHVVDPMAGSGTTMDVCKRMGRICSAFDLYPKRDDIVEHDATQPWHLDEPADLIFIHPPYWNLVGYGNKQNDLSGTATVKEYYRLLQRVLTNAYESLKGKYIVVQQGDLVQDGYSYPLCFETYNILKEIGFIPHAHIVNIIHGDASRKKSEMPLSEYIYQKRLKISDDLILVFKKMNG